MKKRQFLAILLMCACILPATTLSGCSKADGSSSESDTIKADGNQDILSNSIQLSNMTLSGTVQTIDGQTITLEISNNMSMDVPSDDNAQAQTSPDMPDNDENQSATPPDKPENRGESEIPENGGESEKPENGGESEKPQDMPDEEHNNQLQTPDMPSGDNNELRNMTNSNITGTVTLMIGDETVIVTADGSDGSISDISEGDQLTITIDESGVITSIEIGSFGPMGNQASSSGVTDYNALTELTEDSEISDEAYASTGTDENALHIYNGADVSLSNITITRDSSDSTGGDNSSFYGVGAAVLVSDGTATIANSEITTDASGGAGVFAYSNGVAYVKDTTIKTKQNTSGGIHVAGGGTLYAWDLNVETDGESAAAIRSDRGGGTMVVDGGNYISNGIGSPAVYCTADIAVNNADLTANSSEGICIEGKNALRLYDCNLTSNMSDDSRNDCTWSLIVYQSMSGDSEVGNSTLQLVGGSIKSQNGGLIYTTNTSSDILLSNVDIRTADDCEFFLKCTGNANERGWGQTGNNGSQCIFTADSQTMNGDIIYDSISTLDCYMQNGSVLTGAIIDDESCAGNGGDGYCNVTISKDSKWIVTGDSVLSNLHSEGTIQDSDGQTVSVIGTDGTVYVKGSSSYTITVNGYDTNADFSDAGSVTPFSDYEVADSAK